MSNAVDAGEGDLAMQELRRRLAADAKDFDARMLIAKRYSEQGRPDLALEHYRLAAAQFPDSEAAALALAKTLRDMEQPGEALKTAQDYLARHPRGSWELLSIQGILEDDQGRFADAEAAYRSALTISPGRSGLHNNLGYNLLLQGRPEEAAQEFRRAIELDPKSQIAHNNLGVALASQKSFAAKDALSEWQRSSGPAAAHNNLAAVLIEQGRYAEARAELTVALGYQRDFAPALANLKLLSEKDGLPVTVPALAARRGSNTQAARPEDNAERDLPADPNAPALHLDVIEGEGAVNAAGASTSRPLAVEVTDAAGNPVEGAAVSFHLPQEGPGGNFGNGSRTDVAITDSRGRANLHSMQLNRTPGRFDIRIVASKEQSRAGVVTFQYIAQPKNASLTRGPLKWVVLAAIAGGAAAGLAAARSSGAGSSAAAATAPSNPASVNIGSPSLSVGKP